MSSRSIRVSVATVMLFSSVSLLGCDNGGPSTTAAPGTVKPTTKEDVKKETGQPVKGKPVNNVTPIGPE